MAKESHGDIAPTDELTLAESSQTKGFGAGDLLPEYKARAQLRMAFLLVALLAFVFLGAGLLLAFSSVEPSIISDILTLTVPALVALIGTATAFYFTGH